MNREYKIALSQEYYSDIVYLSQYDSDYDLVFSVLDKYSKATQINGYTAKFQGTRTDGLGFLFEGTASDDRVAFHINTSLTAISGTHKGEIVFYDASGLFYGSANVQIVVDPAARPDGTIDADVERAEEIAEQIQQIVDTAAEQTTAEAERIVSDLEADVSELKSGLSEISDAVVGGTEVSIPISWSQGNINTVTGEDETGTRQRSDYIELQQSSFVVTWENPITDCLIYWYDENKVFKRHSGWQTKGTEITKGNKYFRIVARKNGPNQLTDNEIKSFKVLVEPIWESKIQNINTRVDSLEAVNSAFSVDDSILIHDGYFINNNGNLQTYTTSATAHYYATDYVDLSFCEQVKVQTCLGSGSTIAVYNGVKQLTRVITTKGSTAVFDYDITLDSNERYIRASFQEYTNYTTKDQFKLVAYKNVLLALDSISKGGGESNNAVERAQLKPLSAPTVVFIDDDGTDSLWDTTVPIFEEAGVPLTIAVGKDSAIMSDLETLRTWLSSTDHDMVQHSLGSDQDLSTKTYAELISWIESEQAFFYNNGFIVTNLVYGGKNWSEQMIRVVEKYYNCGCTIPNWQLGIDYGYNLPGTSRYKLARYAVSNWTSSSGHSLQDCKDIFDEFLATGQNGIIIFYSHSYQLVDNPDRVQILTDFIDYVKAAQTRGDCTISTLSAVFG